MASVAYVAGTKLSAPANTAYQEPLINQTYRLALPRGGPQSGGAERREHLGGLNGTKCRPFPRRSLVCPAVRRGEERWTFVLVVPLVRQGMLQNTRVHT